MNPGTYNLTIIQGANFAVRFTVTRTGFDFTGYLARAKIRNGFAPDSALLAAFVCTNISAGMNSIVFDMSMSAATTAALQTSNPAPQRSADIGFWDAELYSGSNVDRPLDGKVTLSRRATF